MAHGREVPLHEWSNLNTPDIYFTPEYHATSALANSDTSRTLLLEWTDATGRVFLPLMLRKIVGEGYFDATSAYGYGGPWILGAPDLEAFNSFFEEWAQDNSVVSSFLRFHPLIDNVSAFRKILPIKHVGKTATWDLVHSQDLVQGMAKSHRKNWRRAMRDGLEPKITERPREVERFRSLYETSMNRVSARSSYWLPDRYWSSLRDRLGNNSLLVEAVYDGRVVAAAWCLFTEKFLHFHLSGTSDEGRQLGGAYVCRVAAAKWAKERGLVLAHHGGGVGGTQSSLLDWKHKFDEAATLRDFYVAEVIHNNEVFDRLAEGFPQNQYFPPWRHPSGKLSLVR